MLSLPRARRFVLPALISLAGVLLYKASVSIPPSLTSYMAQITAPHAQQGRRTPMSALDGLFIEARDASNAHVMPDQKYYYSYTKPTYGKTPNPHAFQRPVDNLHLGPLLTCKTKPNPTTNHVRIFNIVQNVTQIPPDSHATKDEAQKFNPAIIALPYWSKNKYLLVSRVVTEGLHQESLLCEANICHVDVAGSQMTSHGEEDACTSADHVVLGPAGGLRCASSPITINIPPTPAEQCTGAWSAFPDIPGFHDPRIFWSGKGEPLIIVNSASRYACVGLWITDLRTLHEPLEKLLASRPGQQLPYGPLMSYPRLTELTRNPASSRSPIEKNWFLFFPTHSTSFLHYDISPPVTLSKSQSTISAGGRTFAKLIGNGFTTPNLTDPLELPCLDTTADTRGKIGHWHQASNALKLILCARADAESGNCDEEEAGRAVHFAVIHRKFSNDWDLPLRYERFFVVWDARPPFHVLAISQHPILFWNETASGWTGRENWSEEMETHTRATNVTSHAKRSVGATTRLDSRPAKVEDTKNWAYFTYTPSIAWAWRPKPPTKRDRRARRNEEDDDPDYLHTLNVGYLDDDVILGIGLDDREQVFARASAETLLQCMRACPGRADARSSAEAGSATEVLSAPTSSSSPIRDVPMNTTTDVDAFLKALRPQKQKQEKEGERR